MATRPPLQFYSEPLPGVDTSELLGKLIVIEGPDAVGRSTQIQLLREWLEVKGYGVVETGWTRSPLMKPTIELAKASNTLNKLTFVLLYATDFAWMEAAEGGLFRLDQENKGGKQSVKVTKVAKLDKPTALAFADDGSVYITIIGTNKEGETGKAGALLKLSGL